MRVVRDGVASFLGGVNTSVPAHKLQANECVSIRNMRGSSQYGSLVTRAGSQRVHTDIFPATITMVGQWEPTLGTQEFLVAGGDFYYKATAGTTWTKVTLTMDQTYYPGWTVHREAGAPRLYFGDGTNLYEFDGVTVSVVSSAPSVRKLAVYKARGFGIHTGNDLQVSAVDTLEDWSIASGGLTTPIETYDAEDLNGLLVIGGSLILTKEDTVSRYSGVGVYDTRIETNTDGISAEVGCIAPQTLIRVGEDVGFMLSDRGPYLVSESGVREIGMKVDPSFDFSNRSAWAGSVAAHNRRRKEIWLFTPNGWWVYNYRTMVWEGPWDYQGFDVTAACRYERSTGQESVLVCGDDFWVRDGDVGSPYDDVLIDGTGGTVVPAAVEPRHFVFGSPLARKNLSLTQTITADLGANGDLEVTWEGSDGRQIVDQHESNGAGLDEYTSRPKVFGERIKMNLYDASGEEIRIDGIDLRAKLGRKLV